MLTAALEKLRRLENSYRSIDSNTYDFREETFKVGILHELLHGSHFSMINLDWIQEDIQTRQIREADFNAHYRGELTALRRELLRRGAVLTQDLQESRDIKEGEGCLQSESLGNVVDCLHNIDVYLSALADDLPN